MFLVKRIVSREGKVHFRRWRLLQTPWFAIYIHCISESDHDKHPHDHPWNFWSLILKGGYEESVLRPAFSNAPDGPTYWVTRSHKRFSLIRRRATEFHRITLLTPSVWSLVFAGPAFRKDNWGYWTEEGWVRFDDYRKQKHAS